MISMGWQDIVNVSEVEARLRAARKNAPVAMGNRWVQAHGKGTGMWARNLLSAMIKAFRNVGSYTLDGRKYSDSQGIMLAWERYSHAI